MNFNHAGNVLCENCEQANGPLYCCFPLNEGFPYVCVCKVCVANIGLWVNELKDMCDNRFKWNGSVGDGADNLLWSEEKGQLFDPDNDTRQF